MHLHYLEQKLSLMRSNRVFFCPVLLDQCNGAIFSTRVIVLAVVYHGAGSVHLKMREARATHYFRLILFWDERSQSEPAVY